MRLVFVSPAASTVIDAARYWRIAHDLGQPVQPTLSTRLGLPGGGFLAPVLDGLLRVFEAAFRRPFRAGKPSDADLTGDERQLLDWLDRDDGAGSIELQRSDLAPTMRAALRSTRIMLKSVLSQGSIA